MSEIVDITLTRDLFECEIIAEAVRAEGYEVHLISDVGENTSTPVHASRLRVHATDLDAIREIIERSHPLS
jgi:hypothetical protein